VRPAARSSSNAPRVTIRRCRARRAPRAAAAPPGPRPCRRAPTPASPVSHRLPPPPGEPFSSSRRSAPALPCPAGGARRVGSSGGPTRMPDPAPDERLERVLVRLVVAHVDRQHVRAPRAPAAPGASGPPDPCPTARPAAARRSSCLPSSGASGVRSRSSTTLARPRTSALGDLPVVNGDGEALPLDPGAVDRLQPPGQLRSAASRSGRWARASSCCMRSPSGPATSKPWLPA
jgi:hypothetical protein